MLSGRQAAEAFAELAKYADSADEIDNDKFEPDLLGHAPAFLSPLRRPGGQQASGNFEAPGQRKVLDRVSRFQRNPTALDKLEFFGGAER